ncbi:hypothetical protein [Pseudomonas fontis]|uniref:Uncharacterized protein n=1 Tax=Pseudomonas fontis TaxID=2942633 RepID=A0ABT5NXQ2_9PSED|nr:hypothetical protein [Pseudomonas fontis]MDD0973835.1 hypothetical protein [Pseudomonas fontis]MDD0992969.1 hypothetical protein [Pseudomonas fontis]
MIAASSYNLGVAAITVALISAATALELHNKPSSGLWLLVVLLVVFADLKKSEAPKSKRLTSEAQPKSTIHKEANHD